jgi:hypothetical protein
MILPVIKNSKWEILTPDGLTDGHTYKSLMAAQKAKKAFLNRFKKIQGYYSSASGEQISLKDLEARVSIVEKK